ncbi:MAG: hypothetical protein E6772_06850 [Dysgonomonas sp.]|nr:hypothetical protein [Dysgonomonas sp.]
MELDELRNTWSILDKKLEENNSLNDRIIKEMLHSKSNKSLGKLLGYEMFGFVVTLLMLPLILYLLFKSHLRESNVGFAFLVFMSIADLICLTWQGMKIICLMKVDFTEKVSQNIRLINTYNIGIKREKLVILFFIPVVCFFCNYLFAEYLMDIFLWIFMSCLFFITIIFTYYQYKRIYDKNIKSILQSLEELKELEE